jgi:uncharacterized repeat protein (TIGR01451 family)
MSVKFPFFAVIRLVLLLFGSGGWVLLTINTQAQVCGSAGKDGPATIPANPNTYFPGVDGTTISLGSTSIPVGTANINGDTTPIAPGDLLLIIQMQDAAINTSNSSSYGGGTGTGSGYTGGTAGFYEFAVATNSVTTSGGTITISSGTVNSYASNAYSSTTARRTYQVVRVMQYSSATLSGTVTGAAWDGSSGGIVVIDVAGALTLSGGTINVSGQGFRGGGGRTLTGGTGTNTDYLFDATTHGASKGEGIAGTPRYIYDSVSATTVDNSAEGYLSGSYGRGAPGNAAGGGNDGNPSANDENSGGGGGGNGGAGGQGGNSWNSNLAVGGIGGAAFAQAGVTRLVMGGGGGAATTNNNAEATASGGAGGGIVILRAGSVSGSGTINVNGANAPTSAATCCDDGAGGGGAGGSVLVIADNASGLSGLTVSARGGRGGNTRLDSAPHGPGGGGGGGVVLANGSLSGLSSVIGGDNGLTGNSGGSNIAFNALPGTTGALDTMLSATSVPGVRQGTVCSPLLTVTKSTTTPTRRAGQRATYTITVSNAATAGWVHQTSVSDTLPGNPHFTYHSTSSVNLSGGAARPSTTNPSSGDTTPVWSEFYIPSGGSVAITFRVNLDDTTPDGVYQNPATVTYPDPTRTLSTATLSASYDFASSTAEDVAVGAPNVGLSKSCTSPADCLTQPQSPGTDLTYQVVFTNTGSEAASSLIMLDAIPTSTDFKIGSATIASGTTGLTFVIEYSSNYDPASPASATWTYTPASGAGGAPTGYDRNVKAVRWRVTAGTLSRTAPDNTGDFGFIVRIR